MRLSYAGRQCVVRRDQATFSPRMLHTALPSFQRNMYPPFVDKEYIKIYVRLDWNIAMRAKAVGTILREHTTSQDCRLVCLGAICVTLEKNKNPKSDYVSLFVGWVTCVRRWNTTKSNYLHIALWVQFVRLWTNTKAECARIVCLAALCATLEKYKVRVCPHRFVVTSCATLENIKV
jgi:hypothetical protein